MGEKENSLADDAPRQPGSAAAVRRTWQVDASVLKTPAMALVFMAAALAACELAVRLPAIRSLLPVPCVGSVARPFDYQLAKLQEFSAAHGIDCIFLGSSIVLTGLDPRAFADGFEQSAGWRPRCFNFGLGGMMAADAGALALMLAADYRPRIMVYGLSARDFSSDWKGADLRATDWLRYRSGTFSLNGLLVERLHSYRYLLLYREWRDPARRPRLWLAPPIRDDGFVVSERVTARSPHRDAAARNLTAGQLGAGLSGAQLAGLDQIGAAQTSGTAVFLAEMPAIDSVAKWLVDGSADYRSAVEPVRGRASSLGIRFVETMPLALVPDEGFADVWHLNAAGAARFSRWLGERIGSGT